MKVLHYLLIFTKHLTQVNWHKAWLPGEKFCLNNKVKEVLFKILHRICPARKTLGRFKLDIEYMCVISVVLKVKPTLTHFIIVLPVESFWKDVQHFVQEENQGE